MVNSAPKERKVKTFRKALNSLAGEPLFSLNYWNLKQQVAGENRRYITAPVDVAINYDMG